MRALSQSLSLSERDTLRSERRARPHCRSAEVRKTSAAVRAHHDQIDVVVLGVFDDLLAADPLKSTVVVA